MAGARSFCLLVAVLMIFSNNCLGFKFSFNGFKSQSELFIVTSPENNWVYNLVNESCYTLVWPPDKSVGRLLYPQAVSMRELGSPTVMSFSTTFIFQIYQHPVYVGKGSGFTFLMVPNNSTIGAPTDFLGLITTTTDSVSKDVASDEHTFGVEFDTFLNEEFNDPNDNHIGLDFASMNSTVSFKPTIPLTTFNETVYHQVWIDYDQAQSTMNISLSVYEAWVVKPAVPSVSWSFVDLSLLSESTFVGFSAAIGTTGADRHSIFAWSFSNEGEAPPISLAKDAPPSGPSPPPPPGTRKPSPPPPRTPPGTGAEPPRNPPKKLSTRLIIVGVVPAVGLLSIVASWILWLCWVYRTVYIFLSHRNVKNAKNFVSRLNDELLSKRWPSRKYRIKVFFDSQAVGQAKQVAKVILKELDRFDLGVVVVTREFFESRWCMTELIAFKDAHDRGKDVRVWPLFYELRPEQVKQLLDDGVWESRWVEFSELKSHPLDLAKCREAARWLTSFRGPLNFAQNESDGERYYIRTILEEMENILKETRSLKAAWARVRRRPAPKKPHGKSTPLPSVV